MKRTISFIEAKTTKDKALQTAIRAFAIIRYGGRLTPADAKVFIDLCSLALPNKYRFPRSTWEQMEKQIAESLHAQASPTLAVETSTGDVLDRYSPESLAMGCEQADSRLMPLVTPEQAIESLNEFTRFWRRMGGDQDDAPDAHLCRRFITQQMEKNLLRR